MGTIGNIIAILHSTTLGPHSELGVSSAFRFRGSRWGKPSVTDPALPSPGYMVQFPTNIFVTLVAYLRRRRGTVLFIVPLSLSPSPESGC